MVSLALPFHKSSGFSLIEIMIALAIVSILTLFAYPTYINYLVKARRDQAQVVLIEIASQLEAYHCVNNTYYGATIDNIGILKTDLDENYQFEILNTATDNYLIQATPINAQAKKDDSCGTLSINATGKKMASGSAPPDECW